MAKSIRRVYWDSCVFLSYIDAVPDRVELIDQLFTQADEGRVQIWTSVLSISEVAFAQLERTNGDISDQMQQAIDKLWLPPRVMLVELHEGIARDAQTHVRLSMIRNRTTTQDNPILAGADACHLATAKYAGVDEFFTYDGKILKTNSFFPFPIARPHVDLQQKLDLSPIMPPL